MPEYLFENPETGEVISIIQAIDEEHAYSEKGKVFSRVFTVPNASIDSNVDPFSAQQFTEKTKNMKGTMGDIWDYSAELSSKRKKDNNGVDPVREKAEQRYSKKRRGIKHKDKM
jgi:beta-xylosidase